MVGTVLARPTTEELAPWRVVSTAALSSVGGPCLSIARTGFGVLPLLRQLGFSHEKSNHVLAGTIARTLAQVTIHPIDTIKTRLQVKLTEPPKKLRKWKKRTKKRQFVVSIANRAVPVRNYANKGGFDLMRGWQAAVGGTVPTALMYFSVYEAARPLLERWMPEQPARVHLGSAAAGALASSVFRVPGDSVRHQVQAYIYRDTGQAVKAIWTLKGLGGFYKGLVPTLLRDVPEVAIQFTVYEALRKFVQRERQEQKLRTYEHLILGGAAGAVAASVTMPLDFIKTRVQCGASSPSALLREVIREKGVQGLFVGVGPRVTQTSIMSALFFTLFECAKLALKPPAERDAADVAILPKVTKKKRDHIWKRTPIV